MLLIVFAAITFASCQQTTNPPPLAGSTIDTATAQRCYDMALPGDKIEMTHIQAYLRCVNRTGYFEGLESFADNMPPALQAQLTAFINDHVWSPEATRILWANWFQDQATQKRWDKGLLEIVAALDRYALLRPVMDTLGELSQNDPEVIRALLLDFSNSFSTEEDVATWKQIVEFATQPQLIESLSKAWEPYERVTVSEAQFWTTFLQWLDAFAKDPDATTALHKELTAPAVWGFFHDLKPETIQGLENILILWNETVTEGGKPDVQLFLESLAGLNHPVQCIAGTKRIDNGALTFFETMATHAGPGFEPYLRFRLFAETSRTASMCALPAGFEKLTRLFQRTAERGLAKPIGDFSKTAADANMRPQVVSFFTSSFANQLTSLTYGASEKKLLTPIVKALGTRGEASAQFLEPALTFALTSPNGRRFLNQLTRLQTLIPTLTKLRLWMASTDHPLSATIRWGVTDLMGASQASPPHANLQSILSDPRLAPLLTSLANYLNTPHGEKLIQNLATLIANGRFNSFVSATATVIGGREQATPPLPEESFENPPPVAYEPLQPTIVLPPSENELACLRIGANRPSLGEGRVGAFLDMLSCESAYSDLRLSKLLAALKRLDEKGLLEPLLVPFLDTITNTNADDNAFGDLVILLKSGYLDAIFDWFSWAADAGIVESALPLLSMLERHPQALLSTVRAGARSIDDEETLTGLMTAVAALQQGQSAAALPYVTAPEDYPSDWLTRFSPYSTDGLTEDLQTLFNRLHNQKNILSGFYRLIQEKHYDDPAAAAQLIREMAKLTALDRTIDFAPASSSQAETLKLVGWDTFELLLTEADFALGWDAVPLDGNPAISTLLAAANAQPNAASLAAAMRSQRQLLDMAPAFSNDEGRRLGNLKKTFNLLIDLSQNGDFLFVQDTARNLRASAPAAVQDSRNRGLSPLGFMIDLAEVGTFRELSHVIWLDERSPHPVATEIVQNASGMFLRGGEANVDDLAALFESLSGPAKNLPKPVLRYLIEALLTWSRQNGADFADVTASLLKLLNTAEFPLQDLIAGLQNLEQTPTITQNLTSWGTEAFDTKLLSKNLNLINALPAETIVPLLRHFRGSAGDTPAVEVLNVAEDLYRYQKDRLEEIKAKIQAATKKPAIPLIDLLLQINALPTDGRMRHLFTKVFINTEKSRPFLEALHAWRQDPDFHESLIDLRNVLTSRAIQEAVQTMADSFQ